MLRRLNGPPAQTPAHVDPVVDELPGAGAPDGEAQEQTGCEDGHGREDKPGNRAEVAAEEVGR